VDFHLVLERSLASQPTPALRKLSFSSSIPPTRFPSLLGLKERPRLPFTTEKLIPCRSRRLETVLLWSMAFPATADDPHFFFSKMRSETQPFLLTLLCPSICKVASGYVTRIIMSTSVSYFKCSVFPHYFLKMCLDHCVFPPFKGFSMLLVPLVVSPTEFFFPRPIPSF